MQIGQTVYIQGFGSENMRAIIVEKISNLYKLKSKYEGTFLLDESLCYGEPTQHCSNSKCVGLLDHIIENENT